MKEELKKLIDELMNSNDSARNKELYQSIVELISKINQ
jgi:hypothetical protein